MPDYDTLDPVVARELTALDDALAGRAVDPDLAELAELAVALRDDRPSIDAAFARELDERAARGFPARRGGVAAGRRGLRQRLAAFRPYLLPAMATALLPIIVVIGIVAGGNSTDMQSAGGGSEGGGAAAVDETSPEERQAAPEAAGGDTGASGAAEPDSSVSSVPPVTPLPPVGGDARSDNRANRKVERSATLTLAAPPAQIDRVADGIVRVTDAVGGFVRSSSVGSSGDGGGGSFELRVPTGRLSRALADLSRLAHVRERSQATQDITDVFVSQRQHLKEARAERDRLLRLLADADTANETASIRARLRLVNNEIGAIRTELARTNNRAAFSTIAVTLMSDEDAAGVGAEPDDGRWTPGDAIRDAGRVLEVAAGVALIALAVIVPLALIAGLGALATTRLARRRRERALDAV